MCGRRFQPVYVKKTTLIVKSFKFHFILLRNSAFQLNVIGRCAKKPDGNDAHPAFFHPPLTGGIKAMVSPSVTVLLSFTYVSLIAIMALSIV